MSSDIVITEKSSQARDVREAIGDHYGPIPTLAIDGRREIEIRAFRLETYFEVVANVHVAGGTFTTRYAPPERIKTSSGRKSANPGRSRP
jgi:DNA topoisomerase IA